MSSNDADTAAESHPTHPVDGVGPTVELSAIDLPADVGRRLQTLYGTDEPPRDAEAWIEATRAGVEAVRGRKPTVADLCDASNGHHRFVASDGDHAQAYVCVIDPLAYSFLTDTPGTIESTTQVRGTEIMIEITPGGVAVSHPDAVISIGVSDHVESIEDVTPEVVYRQICGYIHLFEDRAEYETWAAEVEAATTSVPVETGVGLSKAIANTLFE